MRHKRLYHNQRLERISYPIRWPLFSLFTLCAMLYALFCGLYPGEAVAQQGGEVSSAIIENNVITANTAGSGGGIASFNASSVIRNNLFIQNVSTGEEGGGAIYSFGPSAKPAITGNTFSGNDASSANGGGIYIKEGEFIISNCILWQNQGDLWNGSATYSVVTNLQTNPGTGNLSIDPAFLQITDPDAPGYYRLSENSPCVDAGDPAFRPALKETDIEGKSRMVWARVDIGADELADTQGPAISNAKFDNTTLTDGIVLHQSGAFSLTAADPSSVSRVEFSIDGSLISTDTNGADGYSYLWNIFQTQDGSHTLTITSYDTLGNSRSVSYTINVALNPPSAPTISSPSNGAVLNTVNITVTGQAEKNATVTLYNNNVQTGNPVSVDSAGTFRIPITLGEGVNRLQAAATNRAGTGPKSSEIAVTLDTSIPKAPSNLSALSKPGGIVGLTWGTPTGTSIKGYNLYRATAPFTSTSQAVKVNSSLITKTSFDDLAPADGTYYYGASTVNLTSQEGPLSNIISATSDRTLPRAVSVEYMPTGLYSPTPLRIAQGLVNLRLIVSEPLLSAPFLSITPSGGLPIQVDLTKTSDLEYSGSFMISASEPSGTAYAVFSARDMIGNRGTNIDSGASFIIDTQGPAISSIETQPRQPIKNDQANPVSVTVTFGLNEQVKPGSAPELFYLLSGPGRTQISIGQPSQIATQPGHVQTWQATFTLVADAGLAAVENLQLVYSGVDDLDNVSNRILCGNSFQVYQGNLPPLSSPQTLTGKSLAGGQIKLTWTAVEGAAGYQLYRKTPSDTQLTPYQAFGILLEFTDSPSPNGLNDGLYQYAVASIRHENNQESVSGMSNVVEVASDSIPPGAPQNLVLQLTGSGIKATWEAPPNTEPFTYSLYRSNLPEITSVQGMTPTLTRIAATTAVDAHPSHTDHSYVVTAVDSAGNESLPSNSFYLNFDLLPVSSLKVVQQENGFPVISWTHASGDIAGYNIYLTNSGQPEKLNTSLVTGLNYTDTGFTGDERVYTVTAVDHNGIESLGRSITLPKISATLSAVERIRRNIINRLEYTVENRSLFKVEHIKLKALVGAYQHLSEEFSVEANSPQTVSIPVGGYADLPDLITFATTIEITPEEGELVQIVRSKQIEVVDDRLILQILNEPFTRGGLGKVWFTLENTGEEEIEIITATGSGASASNEVTFYLLNGDGNTLSSLAYKQNLGASVVTLSNGATVARIPAGSIFTSNPAEITVPLTAPDQVSIRVDVTKVHFHVGQPDQVNISGLSATNTISLKDTPYYGEITAITPESSTGEDVLITGRAIDRTTSLPMPSVPLNLVITSSGFERTNKIVTDSQGSFTFTFKPLTGESGIYKVRAVHPDVFDKPVQGQFTISKLSISPTTINLNIPRNYEQSANIQVTSSEGTIAHNLRLVYEEQDQTSGIFPAGVHVTPGTSIVVLGSKQTATLSFKIWGDNTAATAGRVILKVKSDETGNDSWGSIVINTQFSESKPALYYSPDHVETGVAYGQMETETITLENRGLADLSDVSIAVINQNGTPAPAWVNLNSVTSLGVIAVGEKRQVSITFSPTTGSVSEGVYGFYLRVTSSNYQTTNIGIYVSVTQSGIGNAIFKVSDIYTGTVNQSGQLVQGLSGAKITIQNEQVLSVQQTKYTDSLGEILFTDLPAGIYKYRTSAANHQEQIGRLWIKPGITASEQIFLEYNLVTVEWEVKETTIQDKYEIVLTATYQTNVPAAVVVIEPKSVTLPDMKAGDVFYGEFTLTNYGLVRAVNMTFSLPPTDSYYKYEILKGLPTSLEAKERITLPYRVTALKSNTQSDEGGGSGGGCTTYTACVTLGYSYKCVNGVWVLSADRSCFTHVTSCTSQPGTGGTTITIGGPGGGGGGGGGYTPNLTAIAGVKCLPVAARKEGLFGINWAKLKETLKKIFWKVGCQVNTVLRELNDDATDLSVKVPGGVIDIQRLFYGNEWRWEHTRNNLRFTYDSFGQFVQSIDKGGVVYQAATTTYGTQPTLYTHKTYKITRTESGFRWEDKSGNWKSFDSNGRMISYGPRNSVLGKLLYESGESGRLIGISDKNDRQVIWFEYNTANQISAVRDVNSRRVEYTYTANRLSKVKNVLGHEATYEYDTNGKLTKSTDYAGRQTLASYDSYGNVTKVIDRQGNGYFFDYSYDEGQDEYYAQVRTLSGRIEEVWYDREGETKLVKLNGRTIKKIVKDGRNLIITDEKGNVTKKYYDEWDNLTKAVYADGAEVSFEYDLRFNKVKKVIDPRGAITTFQYDDRGNLIMKVDTVGTSTEKTSTYTYDENNQLLSATVAADANTQAATTSFTYDTNGNVATVTDAEGNTTQFLEYDTMGNPLKIKDPRGYEWRFTYDDMGRITSQTNAQGNTTSVEYDNANNRTAIINALLKRFELEYDDHNNLIKAKDPSAKYIATEYNTDNLLTKITDQEGKSIRTEYDNEGRVIKTIDGAGNEVAYYYDETQTTPASSILPAQIDYPTYTRKLFYDAMQRLVRATDILDANTTRTRSYTYDKVGNVISNTDEEGHTVFYEYDPLNRLVKVTDAKNGVVERSYDDRGNLISIKDQNQGVSRYEYDRNNRLVKAIKPLGQETTYEYDAVSNRTAVNDSKGQRVEYGYNEINLITQVRYYGAGNHTTPVKTVNFTYDKLGNVLTNDDGTTSATYTYDDLRKKLSETVNYGLFSKTIGYTYYANGLKKSFTYPDGTTINYTYDQNNRLSVINIPGQGDITYNSYQWNSLAKQTLPGGSTMEYAYDPLMRLKAILAKDPAQNPVVSRDYQYSPAGNITQKNTEHGNYTFEYDELYRLTKETNPTNGPDGTSYAYDSLGNRLTMTGVDGNWTYNSNNELTNYADNTFTYDANGNQTNKATGTSVTNYVYDVEDRLVEVRDGSGALTATYYYDPFGRRLWKDVGGTRTYFLYADEGLISEYDATGAELKTYGYAPNSLWSTNPIYQKKGYAYYWYKNDAQGTPQKIVDSNGRVVWEAVYDAFGNCKILVEEVTNNLRFAGQYFDQETGLHYNWHRYYDPETGRYLQTDPFGEGLNLYAYVFNNPTGFIDPLGLCVVNPALSQLKNFLGLLNQLFDEYQPEGTLEVILSTLFGTALEIANGIMNTPETLIDQIIDWVNDPLNPWKIPIAGPIAENIVDTTAAFYQNPSLDTFVQMWGAWGQGFLLGYGAYELAKAVPTPKLLTDETGAVGKDISTVRQGAKRALAKEKGSIPRSAQPTKQGTYEGPSGTTRWWEYKDSSGNTKIVVEHPDRTVHVGTPKPQSTHLEGGPPRYYPEPGTGHIGE